MIRIKDQFPARSSNVHSFSVKDQVLHPCKTAGQWKEVELHHCFCRCASARFRSTVALLLHFLWRTTSHAIYETICTVPAQNGNFLLLPSVSSSGIIPMHGQCKQINTDFWRYLRIPIPRGRDTFLCHYQGDSDQAHSSQCPVTGIFNQEQSSRSVKLTVCVTQEGTKSNTAQGITSEFLWQVNYV